MAISGVTGAQSVIRPGVCTSATRPASPYDGQMIYETDTDKVLVYNGTAWYANWNTAWGQVAVATKTSDSTMNTGLADMGLSVTWTAVSGRMYKTSFHSLARTTSAGNIFVNGVIADGSNTVKQLMRNGATTTDMRFSVNGFFYESGLSGSQTRKIRADCNTGTAVFEGGATYPMQLIVEDIGPA
jgi:hypothetical protein